MADLTEFQREAVERISENENYPTAVLQYTPDGPQMLMQNGGAGEDDPRPQFDLLAAYVAHLEQRSGRSRDELYDHVEDRIAEWDLDGAGVESERRGGE